MEFMVSHGQAEVAIDSAIYIYKNFIMHNEAEEEKLSKIIISGQTDFDDPYRENFSMMDEEFIYDESKDIFISNRFEEFTLQELAIFISYLDEDADIYFE